MTLSVNRRVMAVVLPRASPYLESRGRPPARSFSSYSEPPETVTEISLNHTKLSINIMFKPVGCRVQKLLRRLCAGTAMLVALNTSVAAQPSGLVVSVAASVYDALDEIAGLYRAATGVTVALNAGGSNTLARQIVEGAK